MANNTPINGLPIPALTDSINIETSMGPLGTALDSRLVARFASEAARDTAIPSPTTGMVCHVTATSAYYFYNGTNWITMYGMQKGLVNLSFGSTDDYETTVTFPVPFLSIPVVITNINSASNEVENSWSKAHTITVADFVLNITHSSSTAWTGRDVQWVAIGL